LVPFFAILPLASLRGGIVGADPDFIRGDVNMDGRITLADVSLYNSLHWLGTIAALPCDDAADANDDEVLLFEGSVPGDGDGPALMNWLFTVSLGTGAQPVLPAPYPDPGLDPAGSTLNCAQGITRVPDTDPTGWSLVWDVPPVIGPGQRVEFFVELTTQGAIEGLSMAYRFDNRYLTFVSADLQNTDFPQDEPRRTDFENSLLFQTATRSGGDPNQTLLLAGAIYSLGPNVINFGPTQGPVQDFSLLRVVFSVKENAPVGPDPVVLIANLIEDYPEPVDELKAIHTAAVMGGGDQLTITPPVQIIVDDAADFLRGDANRDLVLDIADPVFTLNYLFQGTEKPTVLDAADGNDDGVLDLSDATYVLQYLFTGGLAPPPPFGNCGCDPTQDNIELSYCADTMSCQDCCEW